MTGFGRSAVGALPFLVAATVVLGGCGVGSCEGTGGVVDECKEDWTRAECDEWDEMEVNGSSWEFSHKSCESLGYAVQCPDGSWVVSGGDC